MSRPTNPKSPPYGFAEVPPNDYRNHQIEWEDPYPTDFWKYFDLKYWFDKPSSREQYNDQMALSGATGGFLETWHRASEQNEKGQYLQDLYGVDWEDIKYPYLSGLTGSGSQTGMAVARGIVMSKNIMSLYS